MAIHHECELERHIVEQLLASGWLLGASDHYDRARALYPEDVVGWLQDSQPEAWKKLERLNGSNTQGVVLDPSSNAHVHTRIYPHTHTPTVYTHTP